MLGMYLVFKINSAALSCGRRCFEGEGGGDSAVAHVGEHLCLPEQIRAPLRHPHASRGSILAPEQHLTGQSVRFSPTLTALLCISPQVHLDRLLPEEPASWR